MKGTLTVRAGGLVMADADGSRHAFYSFSDVRAYRVVGQFIEIYVRDKPAPVARLTFSPAELGHQRDRLVAAHTAWLGAETLKIDF